MKGRFICLFLTISALCSATLLRAQIKPPNFMLFQNEPNPFDSSGTQISYTINSTCHTHLFVEDSSKILIRTLVDEQQQSGYYVINWDARDDNGELLRPGVYVCSLIASVDSDTLFSGSIEMQFESGVTDVGNDRALPPQRFSLQQNYPNPFNPSTVLSYSMSRPGIVKLTIYDVLGREVETLVNRYQQAGFHSVTFTASNLASGTYFYRLQVGRNLVLNRKMTLMQ